MKVLVACEYSGVVRDAFIRAGHDAISCDLLPSESDFGPHIQGDVLPLLKEEWDLVIAHPPCSYLSHINEWMKNHERNPRYWEGFEEGSRLFMACLAANAPRIAVENPQPTSWARARHGTPSQLISPSHFGDPYQKRTYLWLSGLPPLMATLVHLNPKRHVKIEPLSADNPARREVPGVGYEYDGVLSSHERSRTFPGIAEAMAAQWG